MAVPGQPAKTQSGGNQDDPGRPDLQQHRPQNHLQQVQEHERVGRTATERQQHGQRCHINQQGQKQLGITDWLRQPQAQHTDRIEQQQTKQHHQHL